MTLTPRRSRLSHRRWAQRTGAASCVCLVALLAIWLSSAMAGAAGASAGAVAPGVRPVALPRDHGAHPGFGIEWWYTAGTLTGPADRRYFWFATVWSAPQGLVAKVNVVDLRADRIVLAHEYVAPAALTAGRTRIRVGGFSLGWRRAGALGRWSIDATIGAGRLRLTLLPRRPYMLNGAHGIIRQGPGGPSAYYSEPRLSAHGSLELGGRRLTVDGLGWLDHQWGNFAANAGSLRWNWFACQLRDGRNLMLYQFLNRHDGPSGYRAGTLVTAADRVTHPVRFTVTPLHPSIRPAGALARYPLRWRLRVPGAGIDITVRSLARQQFIKNQFVPSFWEGAAQITRGSPGSCIVESSREIPTAG